MTERQGRRARQSSGADLNVLLADTDSTWLSDLATALGGEGFSVSLAHDGREALQRWHEDAADVVVLEIDLPQLTGLEVCRQIREQGQTPVILVAAGSSDEQVIEGFRAGADAYLTKPVSPQDLARQIRAVWCWVVEDFA